MQTSIAQIAKISYILDVVLVPKEFILPSIITRRKPLSSSARRAGWTGCNISIEAISSQGKIYVVKDKSIIAKDEVTKKVSSLDFIRKNKNIEARGWINDTLNILSHIENDIFKLDDVYRFKDILKSLHPNNNNIEAKIRQQLQILRDNGMLEFIDRGGI